jgi:nucleoside-diphosphate-sugar epimerase
MKVLVTGATGFIGREIVCELAENNHQVFALGSSRKSSSESTANAVFFHGDITDYKNFLDLEKIGAIEVLIHSAGLAHQFGETTKEKFDAVNVAGTENILELAVKLQVKHFILIGSTAVYGTLPAVNNSHQKATVINEDSALDPQTLYAESKLKSEKICRRFCDEKKIALTIFRLAPVIGEAGVGNVARLISAIDKNRFIWIGKGDNLKSLIYKRDVARACATLIEKKQNKTEVFNLAAEPVRMKDFVNEIAVRLNKKIIPVSIPEYFLRTIFKINSKSFKSKKIKKISATVEKWLSDDVYSADRVAGIYGYKTQTAIREAIGKQVDYYKTNREQAEKRTNE